MTVVEDRPTVESDPNTPTVATDRQSSPFASWRLATRLARREVRRRPGRTLLVMLLVAVPVIAMTGASIVARTTTETASEKFSRRFGTADAIVYENSERYLPDLSPPALPTLPDGTQVTSFVSANTSVWTDAGDSVFVYLTDVDLASPITDTVIVVSAGRAPTSEGEVLLAPRLADEFGVGVGDRLTLLRPDLELDVVGIGQPDARREEIADGRRRLRS